MIKKLVMIQKIFLIFCTAFVVNGMISGTALAADHSVIIGFHQYNISAETKLVHDNGGKLKRTFHLITAVSANMSDENISKLKKDSRIAYIVNDSVYQAADEYTNTWGVQYIGSQSVHNQSINGAGVKIAVLDTGIDSTHPDLKDNYKGGFDFVNNDSDPWDDNCLSEKVTCHGTHVSGTIAAELNGFGVVGVAPGASIYAIKVLNGGGFGSASYIISGLEWAVNNKMNIVSMSIEGRDNNPALLYAINAAYNSGILLVAAAGNTGGGPVLYPAAYDSVIAVTTVDQNYQKAVFSPIDPKIELAAPGVNINSTVCVSAQSPNICLTEGYGLLSGTSMAAPHVTGVAALIMSHDMTKTNKEVRAILQNTARHVGTPGRNNVYGFGVVDASNAILGIPASPPIPPDTTPPVITIIGQNPVNITVDNIYTDAGATAVDNVDGPIVVISTGVVNITMIGVYTITYTATDSAGNVATATRIVNIIPPQDTTPPVITINGQNSVNITFGSIYTDAGATAIDNVDGPVAIVTTGFVNTTKVGVYTITYTATDSTGNIATTTRTVNVVPPPDTTPPVITINGLNPANITVGNIYTDAGAVAVDNVDGPVTVISTGVVNTTKIGVYTIIYIATDSADNVATATRTVNVVKPVLTTITVTPSSVTVSRKSSQLFTAIAKDQLGFPMKGIIISWSSSVTSIGTVIPTTVKTDTNGQATTKFTASAGRTGTTIVTAKSGTVYGGGAVYGGGSTYRSRTVSGRATVTVIYGNIKKIK
jgi:subtilisin